MCGTGFMHLHAFTVMSKLLQVGNKLIFTLVARKKTV
jgi:hypothetical protein